MPSPKLNPKWVAFLAAKGMTCDQADALDRQSRISLNAEFICATMKRREA